MATTNFIDNQTLIMASWANDVNAKTYGVAYATAAGTADALTATIPAPVIALVGGTMIYVAAIATNTTTAPTINVNGLGAKTITKFSNAALVVGDIGGASHNMALLFNAVAGSWVLLNPAAVNTHISAVGPITIADGVTSVTSQTGTGTKFVVDTSPTLVTPALGTPTALIGTNITGTASALSIGGNSATVTTNANLSGHVTSVGNTTSLGSFTVAQLNTAISDADVATGGGTATGTNTGDQVNISGNAATASALKSATTSVDTAAAAAPTAGQVLKASSGTAATWATPTGGWGF